MDSWAAHATPNIKFENSPVESVLSTPDGIYSSLFSPPSSTMDPHDIMSPHSFDGSECDLVMRAMSAVPETPADAPSTPSASADKKPTKKRKSWGQVLPEPKTNLPPRKRAKTEDEKEQRRVERVLRNRRAAQSSRERKRQEVENLEKRNKDLESALRKLQQDNTLLLQQLQKAKQDGGVSSALTFSQPLFSSQDAQDMLPSIDLDQLLNSPSTNTTVNPASLSPAMTPVPEEDDESDADDEPATVSAPLLDGAAPQNASASPDSAQHPAVSVGGSLAFPVAGAVPEAGLVPGAGSAPPAPLPVDVHPDSGFSLSAAVDADRYLYESELLSSPNSSDLDYDHLVGDDSTNYFSAEFNINDYLFETTDATNNSGLPLAQSATNNLEQPQQHHFFGCAVADSSLLDLETQVSQEDSYLQPQPGASLVGCDAGGLAVGIL